MQEGGITTEAVERVVASVLARPEFAPPPPSFLRVLLDRALGWLGERIGAFFRWLFPDLDATASLWRNLLEVVWFVLILVGLALLAYLGRLAYRTLRARERRRRGGNGTAKAARARTAEDWESEARAAAGAGRWRAASLALYQAVLLRLERRGAVTVAPAKTPGDYRREARRQPEARASLEAFLRAFEPLAFGRAHATSAAYELLRSHAEPLGARG